MQKIGYLTQDVYIFSGTVKENLFEGLEFSNVEAYRAIKQAGIED